MTFRNMTVQQGVEHINSQLTKEQQYVAEEGGFSALHDTCDANMLLPFATDDFLCDNQEKMNIAVDFWNAVMAEFDKQRGFC